MTKRWVKQELRKNWVKTSILKIVIFTKANKNNLLAAGVIIVVVALFVGVIIRNKIEDNRNASRIYAFAQSDFHRFNYEATINRVNEIIQNFPNVKIMDNVLYLKGLSHIKMNNLSEAKITMRKALDEHPKSKIVSQIRFALAFIYEEMEKYEEALKEYAAIPDNDYLKPESLIAEARINELQGRTQEAIRLYTRIQSHYANTFWGNFASSRLSSLGILPVQR